MNIRLHIERLILDGVPLEAGGTTRLQAAVESELGRLLAEGGLSTEMQTGIALPSVRAGDVRLGEQASPIQMGGQIARAVYTGIGRK